MSLLQRVCRKMCLVGLLLLFPFFFLGGPDFYSSRSFKELWELGHPFFFFLLTLQLNTAVEDFPWDWRKRVVLYVIVVLLLGCFIEAIQVWIPGRTSNWHDVLQNIDGLIIALLWLCFKGARTNYVRAGAMLSSLALLAVLVFPLSCAIYDEWRAYRDFPVLADFEAEGELGRWRVDRDRVALAASPVKTGKKSLAVWFGTTKYSGLQLVYFPHDWRGYTSMVFSVYNPGMPIELHVRVHDNLHRHRQIYEDRYNAVFSIGGGWNDVTISVYDIRTAPKGRLMDTGNIAGVGLFVTKQPVGRMLYFDSFHLAKDGAGGGSAMK